jgi:hypothetical protein
MHLPEADWAAPHSAEHRQTPLDETGAEGTLFFELIWSELTPRAAARARALRQTAVPAVMYSVKYLISKLCSFEVNLTRSPIETKATTLSPSTIGR